MERVFFSGNPGMCAETEIRYSFSSPKALLPSIEVVYFEELRMKKPSFIVIQNGRMDEIMEAFLEEYKYQKIWFLDGIAIYEKGDSNA